MWQQLLTVTTYGVTKHKIVPRTCTDTLVRPPQSKMNMKHGTWNIRSLYRAGSLKTAARVLARYRLDLVGAQEVKWDKVRTGDYFFSMEKLTKIVNLEQDFVYTTLCQHLRK